ncbi:MAG: NAD(P)/FAD-dependent oxidoreductase, partial [Gammaproteobacteria bacterium]
MSTEQTQTFDAIIVGAGFAGLYALHRMNRLGLKAVVLEAASGIGGTWYWNAYPGARCDVESYEYSFSFDDALQQSWRWSERYAKQPEILRYLQHVAKRYDLLKDIRLDTKVESAHWDETDARWRIGSSAGEFRAQYLLMATGCLSQPNMPKIRGLETFQGESFHSSRWPRQGIELTGRRVGVIGTGSSGVQIIGNIAPEVDELYVFQRTPHWVIPAGNRAISADEDMQVKRNYGALREKLAHSLLGMGVDGGTGKAVDASPAERHRRYETAWQIGGPTLLLSFEDLLFDPDSNATACAFIAEKIRRIVDDPDTAEALIPDATRYPIGARRLVQSDKYYDCFNRDTVHLVDARRDPISEITATGITQASGAHTELDVIVFATGFDALTGALLNIDIRGREGVSMKDKWTSGPTSWLGLVVANFPNLFTITGPGSPSVFSNVALSIEQHVDFIADLIDWMRANGLTTTEAEEKHETEWARKVIEAAQPTVMMRTESWYWGANVDGKPRAFLPYLGGVGAYREECEEISGA